MSLNKTIKIDNKIELMEEIEDHINLIVFSFNARMLSIFAIALGVYLTGKLFDFYIFPQTFVMFCVWGSICGFYCLIFKFSVFKTERRVENVHVSYYIPAIICMAGIVHFLGGTEWIGYSIFLLELTYASILMQRTKSIFIAVILIAVYFLVTVLEKKGIILQNDIFISGIRKGNYLATTVIMQSIVLFFAVYTVGIFYIKRELRKRRLLESKNRFAAKAQRLENLARVLREKDEENKYLKKATVSYIERKEYELEIIKKDLEAQIEKLRKTQKSMFFMIEDLNEMSAQLKDARDNLEDKVKERTNELMEINRKLHRSERLAFMGKLAGSVTHELRNPLGILKNAVYILNRNSKPQETPDAHKYLGIIEKEIDIIDSIIDDIMGFAKTEPAKMESVKVKKLIDDVISSIKVPDLIEVRKEYKSEPTIKVDCRQVLHALANLVNNAIIAMNGNGTLTFRIFEKEEQICIEVEDTGAGIPEDQRDLIFEPLYSSKPKGTGLGLPIAKMMIEKQEGKIEYTSILGEGTVFRICFPKNRMT